jgi:ubiquinol-cytochrome c reductase cytochrome b subunit
MTRHSPATPTPSPRSSRRTAPAAALRRALSTTGARPIPLHWTTLLGVVSLTCLIVLSVTGVVLLFFYEPSSQTVTYSGSYLPLQGAPVSAAYASTLHVSFDVPGGLLVRQMHHWAALLLPGSLMLQMLSTFFGGGHRRPRHWSWVLLTLTFVFALGAGWSGYALPDDLLAGTGLRIVEGIMVGIPVVGTRASFLFFGGEFPGTVVEHMYWLHVAVLPALLLVVLLLRVCLAVGRDPRRPAPGGKPVVHVRLAALAVRAVGMSAVTAGLLAVLGGLATINPVWIYGPASAGHASAGSQPDWYTAFLDGSLRLVPPGWEVDVFGHTVSLAILVPQAGIAVFMTTVLIWPFLEGRTTRERHEPETLDRPREHPVRTAFGVAGLVFFCGLWAAGATDIVTVTFGISFEYQVVALRTVVLLGPLIAFPVSRAICQALVEGDSERAEHGVESGVILRDAAGGYSELLLPDTGRTALAGRDQ